MDRLNNKLKDEKFAEFYKKYLEVIADDYEELEKTRQKYLSKSRNIFLFGDFNKEYQDYLKDKILKNIMLTS